MGHSDSTVTLEVYSHFIPDTQEKAVFALITLQNRLKKEIGIKSVLTILEFFLKLKINIWA